MISDFGLAWVYKADKKIYIDNQPISIKIYESKILIG